MTTASRSRPGAGFVLLVSVALAAVALLAWGLARPPLQTAWKLQIELMVGQRPALQRRELRLLGEVLQRHQSIAANMLDDGAAGLISANDAGRVDVGYAYLVRRTADGPSALVVTPAGTAVDATVRVSVAVSDESGNDGAPTPSDKATHDAPFAMTLPSSGRFPQLVEVLFSWPDSSGEKGAPPVVVELKASP